MNVHSSITHKSQELGAIQMPVNEWMEKPTVSIHTMEYESVVKKDWSTDTLPHGWTSKPWCCVKEAKHKKSHVVWFHFYEMVKLDKAIEIESWLVVAWGNGNGGEEKLLNAHGVFIWDDEIFCN